MGVLPDWQIERDIKIRIADNGTGFDRARIAEGLGLRLIHERLERIGGQVHIDTGNGHGTVLTVRAPTENHHEAKK